MWTDYYLNSACVDGILSEEEVKPFFKMQPVHLCVTTQHFVKHQAITKLSKSKNNLFFPL